MKDIPILEISVPEYQVNTEPDHNKIGKKIDNLLKTHFLDQDVVIRCLGSEEHPDKSIDDLIEIIKKMGTDRYDPKRKGEKYDNVENKQIDFFALPFHITKDSEIFKEFTYPFYHYSQKPIRIDIIIIYDPEQLKTVIHTYDDGRTKEDGYVFKNPGHKKMAIKGICKVL